MPFRRSSPVQHYRGRRACTRKPSSSHRPRSTAAVLSLFLALLFLLPTARAQTTIHVPADQPTIQAAINAANTGDTVLVSPGTYYENIDFKGKAITVTSSAGSATTIIDGGNITSTVTFATGELRSSILNGFTIQHGQNPGSPAIEGGPAGGGIYIFQAAPTILNNVVTQNLCSGILSLYGAPLIQGNTINQTDDTPSGCDFHDNAPIMFQWDLQSVDKTTTLISSVIGNTIEHNSLLGDSTTSQDFAGGIGVMWASATIQNNIIRFNTVNDDDGGIRIDSSPGTSSAPTFIVQNLIYGNSSYCGGAGLSFEFFSPANVGAVYDFVINNTIANNISLTNTCPTDNLSPGNVDTYWVTNQVAFINNIISTTGPLPALFCHNRTGFTSSIPMTIFDHNDFYSSAGNTYSAGCAPEDLSFGNISADPQFVDSASGNFHLKIGSPAIDAGNNSASPLPTLDLAGQPRIQDSTGQGTPIIDMGAYEASGAQDATPGTLLLTPSAYEVSGGHPLTLTATLLSPFGAISGPVSFFEDHQLFTSGVTDSTGSLLVQSPPLAPGIHHFTATYAGQGSFAPTTSVEVIVLVDLYVPSITITSSLNPSTLNQSVTFTLTASSPDNFIPSPIALIDSTTNTTLATLNPNSAGVATFTTTSLSLGSHLIQAEYGGDSTHNPAQANLLQQVLAGTSTTTTLTSSLNPATFGQSVTFTAAVTSTSTIPVGTITFSDGTTVLATQPIISAGGFTVIASFSTNTLTVGAHTITATYNPGTGFAGSSATLTQNITGIATTATLTSSLNPAPYAQSVTFTSTITSASTAPTGAITFSDGATVIATLPLAATNATTSTASFSSSALTVGTHNITASYSPTGGFSPSTSNLSQVITALPTTTSLTGTPNPQLAGQPVTLTASISGSGATPTGSVTFYDGTFQLGTSLAVAGNATFTFSTLTPGTHTLTAVYAGSAIFSTSTSAPFTETITAPPPDFTISLASPTITIQTQHHLTTTLALTSLNNFADSLAIACANLPAYVTCKPSPTPSSLTAGSTNTISLYLDTDSVLGYAHLTPAPPRSKPTSPINLALILSPFGLFAAIASRRAAKSPLRLLTILLAATILTAALGCGEVIYPYDVPPFAATGTYTIPITATGAASGVTHTANLTLQITP